MLNIQNHLNITINIEIKSISLKGVILNLKNISRAMIMITNKIYLHLLHECLVIKKVLVVISKTVFFFRSNISYDTTYFGFIPGSLEDIDKYIDVTDGHHVTEKQKGQVQIKCAMIMEILSSRHCTM